MRYRYLIITNNKCNCGHTWVNSEVWCRDGDGYYREELITKGKLKYKLDSLSIHKDCYMCNSNLPSMQEFQESGGFSKIEDEEEDIFDILGDL